jgi:hypothetical protein
MRLAARELEDPTVYWTAWAKPQPWFPFPENLSVRLRFLTNSVTGELGLQVLSYRTSNLGQIWREGLIEPD